MQRYFVAINQINGNKVVILGDDFHHITKVMRMKQGDKIVVASNGKSWLCEIVDFFEKEVHARIVEELHENKELPVLVTIAHGLVRREKSEEVIDKITQLGAFEYVQVVMERSNVKLNDEKLDKKIERMNKIAKEASEQSHRTNKLLVSKPLTFKELLKNTKKYDLLLYAYEKAEQDKSLKKLLTTNKYQNILVLIGPEGGISEQEVRILEENNFLPITLGPRILRTEVAPTYVMAAISYQLEV